ncbi:LysR family transcriptional regulator [Paraburkholderia dipogonis]|uniref:LysR family transcriptional regulator n=1 Tax=Paraburkholderia dipogonis TaxID=1211383 RepID=UPI0035EF0193
MNLKQLEAFAAISALHTTTAAAQRLGCSQSAVSRLLSQFGGGSWPEPVRARTGPPDADARR